MISTAFARLSIFDNFISGYTAFSKIRKKTTRMGRHSGGVTVFVTLKCGLVDKGYIDFLDFDDCVVLILKGCSFNLSNDIVLCFPFVPSEGSTVYNQTGGTNGIDLFEDNLLQIVTKYPDASLLLAGDFNAGCGNLQDILHDDNVDYIFDQDSVYEANNFSHTEEL